MNDTLSNNYFRAEFQFKVLPNPQNQGAGAVLLAFTAGTEDFLTYDASVNYLSTDQDGLGIVLVSTSTNNNNIDDWYLQLNSKDNSIETN